MTTGNMPSFEAGKTYRRRDLHELFGGQWQGGIVTPKRCPIILLITGDTGGTYGYIDGFRDDGTFWYTGAGQVGDMEWVRGNLAIRNHAANGKALHLFEDVRKGQLRYIGEATYIGHHIEAAPDRNNDPRKAIVFELEIRNSLGTPAPDLQKSKHKKKSAFWTVPLKKLRAIATAESPNRAYPQAQKVAVKRRSEAVKIYVLRRANGFCESCSEPAPFENPEDIPYLEPHHTQRLADDGPDHPRWVGAVCPNCHARIHYGKDGKEINKNLIVCLAELEEV